MNEKANKAPLTGLQNRVFLDGKMEELYRECLEKGTDMTVMMIDVDDFKKYNDTFGHQAGEVFILLFQLPLRKKRTGLTILLKPTMPCIRLRNLVRIKL